MVDKLSEVRSAEEDKIKEIEEQEKERKQRHDQITALRCPEENIRQRTIRRLIRFQAHNPAERARALKLENNSKNFWRQNSLPQTLRSTFSLQNIEFRRATSTPHESVSSYGKAMMNDKELGVIEEEGGVTGKEGTTPTKKGTTPTKKPMSGFSSLNRAKFGSGSGGYRSVYSGRIQPASTKRMNPLSLMRNPSSYIDEQKLRLSGSKLDNPVTATAGDSRTARMKMKQKKVERKKMKSRKKSDGGDKPNKRHMSLCLSPDHKILEETSGEVEEIKERPVRRSHSLPVDAEDILVSYSTLLGPFELVLPFIRYLCV